MQVTHAPNRLTSEQRIPFVRLDDAYPDLFAELQETVARVARNGAFTLGSEVENFEESFAAFCGSSHAIGVSSGTMALELALRGLGIGPGDEAIVPANSFFATAEAVSATGAIPRFVDVDPGTGLITAETVESALTRRTRCVVPVHLFGRPVDMDPLVSLCRPLGVGIVEDACQAHGAVYRGRPVGSLGDAACFSFYPTKNLGAWGDGGAVVTGDSGIAARVRSLRSHGETVRHRHEVASGTHRLHALQAAILNVKLDRLAEWNALRRSAADVLTESLEEGSVALPPPVSSDCEQVFHLFVVRSEHRDSLRRHLAAAGIASAVHYPTPIHLQPAYSHIGLAPGALPVVERLATEICSLPIFPSIEGWQLEAIAAAVRQFDPAGTH